MTTKIITVEATPPAESTGADYYKGAPLNAAEFDQNLVNLRAAVDRKASLNNPTFTGTVTLPSTTSIGDVSATELQYLNSVTSNVQDQINAKAPINNPTFTGTVSLSTGTANGVLYLNGSKQVTSGSGLVFDSSGNLGLGVTPSAWGSTYKALQIGTGGSVFGRTNTENQVSLMANAFPSATAWTYIASTTATQYQQAAGAHYWSNAPSGTAGNDITWNTPMTLDSSGNLLVGTTSRLFSLDSRLHVTNAGLTYAGIFNRDSNGTLFLFTHSSSGGVGSIDITTTGTSYNTASDYRLKEDYQPVADAIVRLNHLKPINFAWKVDGSRCDGFLAHELQEVIPEAATGHKDEMRTEEYEITPKVEATFDEEGNELTPAVEAVMGEREVPVYQGIDQSKIVPLLTAAMQEAVAKIESQAQTIESLTQRIEALEYTKQGE